MKTKTIYHPIAIRLLQNIVDDIPECSSGTYNRQDPSHFSKGEKVFEYKDIPFYIKYFDCTWGIEITIYRAKYWPNSKTIWKSTKIAGFYLTEDTYWDAGWKHIKYIICRQSTSKGLFRLLAKAFPECMKSGFISTKQKMYE